MRKHSEGKRFTENIKNSTEIAIEKVSEKTKENKRKESKKELFSTVFHTGYICRHTDTYRLEQESKRLKVFKRFIADYNGDRSEQSAYS